MNDQPSSPWPALWALVIGFFMVLVDNTIVSVATPAIGRELGADVNAAIWVTSAYLLAYAVPLLVTGRLGDRFGPKWIYLIGLSIFTASSLWCGLTGSLAGLIVARVWRKRTRAGIRHTVAVVRLYRNGDLWKESARFQRDDLPVVRLVLDQALTWIYLKSPGTPS